MITPETKDYLLREAVRQLAHCPAPHCSQVHTLDLTRPLDYDKSDVPNKDGLWPVRLRLPTACPVDHPACTVMEGFDYMRFTVLAVTCPEDGSIVIPADAATLYVPEQTP